MDEYRRKSEESGRTGSGRPTGNRPAGGAAGSRRPAGSGSAGSRRPAGTGSGAGQRPAGSAGGQRSTGSAGSARMQDPRARARAKAARRRRQIRQRRIIIGTGILILVLIACAIFFGVSNHKKRAAQEAAFQEGITAMESGSYEAAIAKFDEALAPAKGKAGKFEVRVLERRSEAEYQQGDYAAAKATLEILEKKKSQEDYQKKLSMCEAKLGNYEAALAYGVMDAWVYNQMALKEIADGDNDAALGHIEQGIAANDAAVMPDLLYNQAVAYENKGDFAKALELYESYLEKYGPDENVEREVTFLKTRQGDGGGETASAPAESETTPAAPAEGGETAAAPAAGETTAAAPAEGGETAAAPAGGETTAAPAAE